MVQRSYFKLANVEFKYRIQYQPSGWMYDQARVRKTFSLVIDLKMDLKIDHWTLHQLGILRCQEKSLDPQNYHCLSLWRLEISSKEKFRNISTILWAVNVFKIYVKIIKVKESYCLITLPCWSWVNECYDPAKVTR